MAVSISVRPETPADYPAIARVHSRAFGIRMAEAAIVALLRQTHAYDPALSLVAEAGGQIAGHVLFTRYTIRLLGQAVPAVLLAPIGVDPAMQGQGIGGALIEEGHRIAREKGAALSFLLGHVTYYTRFGYRPGAYGWTSVNVPVADVSPLHSRSVTEDDVPALVDLWRGQEGQVDFAIEPEPSLVAWLSPNPAIRVTVYERDGRVLGYTRIHASQPDAPRYFLAVDDIAARAMIASFTTPGQTVTLPLHPASGYVPELGGEVQVEVWDSGMALSLNDSPYDDYEREVRARKRPLGRPLWPTAFELE